jgi:uncharacterized protein (TIRG00374 family)
VSAKKALRFTVGLVIAALFTWLVLGHVDSRELLAALSGVVPGWLFAALIAFFVGYACRIERWRQMLRAENPGIKWRDCALPLFASFAVNNVLPFRAGDIMRSFAFCGRLGASSGTVIATLLVERVLDLLVLLLALAAAIALLGAGASLLGAWTMPVLLAVSIVLVATLLLLPTVVTRLGRAVASVATRMAPGFGAKITAEVERCVKALHQLSRAAAMPKLVAWSMATWAAEGLVFYAAALAMPALSNGLAAWLALPVGTLATLIPSTPGYIGTFDYFTAAAMRELGNQPAVAVAYAYLVHMLLWLPPTLVGGIALALHPGLRKAGQPAPQQ